jgi:hypothetical protein
MPKISVRVPHSDPKAALGQIKPGLERLVSDFQGHDLKLTGDESKLVFDFKSLAFTITGRVLAEPSDVVVEVDLPFAALMFKDKVQKALNKHVPRMLGLSDKSKDGERKT